MPLSNRSIQDALLTVATALPAAAANVSSVGIDLGQPTAFPINEKVELELSVPATPSLVDAKTIIYTFQDSADNITFAAIPELATLTSTGAGGVGAAAVLRNVKLPSSTRKFVGVNAAVLAAGGSNIAISFTVKLKT